jgi:hypothetical protein
MTESPPTRKLLRYRDVTGRLVELWVESECWRQIEAYDRLCRRRDAQYHKTHTTFTDRGAEVTEKEASRRRDLTRPSQGGHAWEGPTKAQVAFSIFLGSSPTWWGDPSQGGTCAICQRKMLSTWTYCLGCDRCGREKDIEKPTSRDLAKRAEPKAPEPEKKSKAGKTLRGGVG